jgi:hypothetical protein
MIKFFTNRELSEKLNVNLPKWKRWSREFLPPDPLGGMQAGYARQYNPDEAFTVFLGGHLVADLKFTIPEAKQMIQDLQKWLSNKGFCYDLKGNVAPNNGIEALIKRYVLCIQREKGSGNHFKFLYTARGIISTEPAHHRGFEIMKKLYVETPINWTQEEPSEMNMNVVNTLNISGVLSRFVGAVGLDRAHYRALSF